MSSRKVDSPLPPSLLSLPLSLLSPVPRAIGPSGSVARLRSVAVGEVSRAAVSSDLAVRPSPVAAGGLGGASVLGAGGLSSSPVPSAPLYTSSHNPHLQPATPSRVDGRPPRPAKVCASVSSTSNRANGKIAPLTHTVVLSFPAVNMELLAPNFQPPAPCVSRFADMFPDINFDCYRTIIPWVRVVSEQASNVLDMLLPQSGPVIAKDFGLLLSYLVFVYDLKNIMLPRLTESVIAGYNFLHFETGRLLPVVSIIVRLLNFNGFVGGVGVDPVEMINVAASVGATTIAANEASSAFRDSLAVLVNVSTMLTAEEGALIKRERRDVRFTSTNSNSSDHPLMAAYREIIRSDYNNICKIKSTKLRTLVLGAASREYRMYHTNAMIYFQIANREGKDTDRLITELLTDVRKNKLKKVSSKLKNIESIQRTKDEIVSTEQMLIQWKKLRNLPERFLLWEESQNLFDHGTIKDEEEESTVMEEVVDSLKQLCVKVSGVISEDVYNLIPILKDTSEQRSTFDQLVFEDVGYNFDENDWYNIFKNTGAFVAYGYLCLPWQLIFQDMLAPTGYNYRTIGNKSHLAYPGYSNGYAHFTKSWSTILRTPVMKFPDMYIGIEILSRAGPMACVKLFKTNKAETFTRVLALPQYLKTVRLLYVGKCMFSNGTIDTTKLQYFPVRLEEFHDALNFSLDVAEESLSFRAVMVYIRRKHAGMSLVNRDLSKVWTCDRALIPEFALVVFMYAVVKREKFRVFETDVMNKSFWKFGAKIKQLAKFLALPVLAVIQFFSNTKCLEILVKDMPNEFWQVREARGPRTLRPIQLFTGANPEDCLDESVKVGEIDVADMPDCGFCEELYEAIGRQRLQCDRTKDEMYYHEFGLSSSELNTLRTKLMDTATDPIGLRTIKENALKKVPPAPFSHSVRVRYICGPPGTGKSHAIRGMAASQDIVITPFARLKEDYTDFVHPKFNTRRSIKCYTQHSGFDAMNHTRVFVDEYTAMPYECLAIILFNCSANEVVLVGDHRQTALINEVEGIAISTKLEFSEIRTHELVKNYRNPADTVAVLNTLYDYKMQATNSRRGYLFKSTKEFDNYRFTHTPLFFKHSTADYFGLKSDSAEKVTVRANQGATFDNVVLVVTNEDENLFNMPSMAIVALSRHRQECVIMYEEGPAAVFASMVMSAIPPEKFDEGGNKSDDDKGTGPNGGPSPPKPPKGGGGGSGRGSDLPKHTKSKDDEPSKDDKPPKPGKPKGGSQPSIGPQRTGGIRIDEHKAARDEAVRKKKLEEEAKLRFRTKDKNVIPTKRWGDVEPDVGRKYDASARNFGEGSSANAPIRPSQKGQQEILSQTERPIIRQTPEAVTPIPRPQAHYQEEVIRSNQDDTSIPQQVPKRVKVTKTVQVDDDTYSVYSASSSEPPTENRCMLTALSEATDIPIKTLWKQFKMAHGPNLRERIKKGGGLTVQDLDKVCLVQKYRVRVYGDNDDVYMCGKTGPVIASLSFSGPPTAGHFDTQGDVNFQLPVPRQQIVSSTGLVINVPRSEVDDVTVSEGAVILPSGVHTEYVQEQPHPQNQSPRRITGQTVFHTDLNFSSGSEIGSVAGSVAGSENLGDDHQIQFGLTQVHNRQGGLTGYFYPDNLPMPVFRPTTINIGQARDAILTMFEDNGTFDSVGASLELAFSLWDGVVSFAQRIGLMAIIFWLKWYRKQLQNLTHEHLPPGRWPDDDDDPNNPPAPSSRPGHIRRRMDSFAAPYLLHYPSGGGHVQSDSSSVSNRSDSNRSQEEVFRQFQGLGLTSYLLNQMREDAEMYDEFFQGIDRDDAIFSRYIPRLTGGSDTTVVPLTKLEVADIKKVHQEPLAQSDPGFLEMARLFTNPIYVSDYLFSHKVIESEPYYPLEPTPFDCFKTLVEDFATADEDELMITNQEALFYVEEEFGTGVYDTTKDDRINARGHPKADYEYAWSILAVSPGVTYLKNNFNQAHYCMQNRYLTRKMVTMFNYESVQKACVIADLFVNEHMDVNFDIMNDQDIWTTTIESEHSMKIKNYEKQSKFEYDGDIDVRFTLKDIFKPFKTKIDLFKAGQGISAWSKDTQTIFQTSFRVINKHFINCLLPHVVYDNGIDEVTLMNRVNALLSALPSVCVNGVIDATACDSGQNRFTQMIERRVLERLGVSDTFLDWYYTFREKYTLKGYGIVADIKDIKTSGEPATLLNNTILMAALMNYLVRGEGPCVLVIKGDDGLKRQANIKYDERLKEGMKKYLKMEFKVDIDVPITFCGYFLTGSVLVPDLVRKVFKVLGHRFRDYQHFKEYQQSLRDWILNVNRMGVNDICFVASDAYSLEHDYCYSLFHSLVSLSHINKNQFEAFFTLRKIAWDEPLPQSEKWSQKTNWYKGPN